MSVITCFICGADARLIAAPALNPRECNQCGRYRSTDEFLGAKSDPSDEQSLLLYLGAHTRQATERGEIVTLGQDWRDFAELHASTPVLRKLEMALEYLASKSEYAGAEVVIRNVILHPLFDAANKAEADYLLSHLAERGDIKTLGRLEACVVTPTGWARLDAPIGGIPGRCFVAMSFDPTLTEVYELGIQAALVKCKLVPVRLDFIHHNEKICDKILAEIRRSQVMVADFTLQRSGVYFEAGFAMGLGRQVIWTCRADDVSKLHFDTRQYNHIVWTTTTDLRDRLIDRIRATIPVH